MTESAGGRLSAGGPLVLAGGAEFDQRMAVADRVWLGLLGKRRPRLGLVPTANDQRPQLAAAHGVRHFESLGAAAEAVMITDRDTAESAAIIAQIATLDAAYMAGGNPRYLAAALAGSAAWRALSVHWREGMALGGSSAGAMAMCERIFVQGGWADGLGLVPGAVLLPHFNNRAAASVEAARQAIREHSLTGIGVDESTALIWHAGIWRTAGPGRVVVFDAAGTRTYGDSETVEGLPEPG